MEPLTFDEARARHAALLIDAYGVLVDGGGALPGAAEAITALEREGVAWLLLTNDASRLPARNAARLRSLGIPVTEARVLSSGMLLAPQFRALGLQGARCVVLGSADSQSYVRDAGGEVAPPTETATCDALVIADDSGFDFLPTMEAVLTGLMHAVERGRPPALLLPNPDLIYPARGGAYGFTAGTLAAMLEGALTLRFADAAPRFTHLGKPAAMIFEAALARLGTRDALMLGDQIHTDIAGAAGVGIPSALLLTGLTTRESLRRSEIRPTYVIERLGAG
jgi:HAD superfamily hydrolase (TIGR01450 family)